MRAARPGRFQRRNFALARAAAEAFLGELDREPGRRGRRGADRARAASSGSPRDPPTFLDAAHNPDGAAALAEALRGGRRRPARSSPAWRSSPTRTPAAMVGALAPAAGPRASAPSCRPGGAGGARPARRRLAQRRRAGAACAEAGLAAEAEPRLRARRCAAPASWPPSCPAASLLVTGSHYALAPARAALLADCARIRAMDSQRAPARNCSR